MADATDAIISVLSECPLLNGLSEKNVSDTCHFKDIIYRYKETDIFT